MGYYKIVSDENRDISNTDLVKEFFIRRDFTSVAAELEKEKNDSEELIFINKALVNHILGNYDEANEYYEKLKKNEMGYVNYLACCHRYFDYKKLDKSVFAGSQYKSALDNNFFNYLVATNGIDVIKKMDMQHSIYTEQIVNDLYSKIGKSMLHEQNDILKSQYLKTVEVQDKKIVQNEKKKIGIFVTDIQRHKDPAIIFELVECLKEQFEIVIYFNNIFANKLAKRFESICTVRYVINLYYEEINNLIYDDEIDILIDMAEFGLRNNNIALSMVKNCITLHELLYSFPILLETDSYYSYECPEKKEDITCVIGDMRCLSDEELKNIHKQISGHIVFESHSLDESVFKDYFEQKLIALGYNMNRIELLPGILPFSRYMNYIASCKNVVITSGTSYVELSEVMKSHTKICFMSGNPLIRKTYENYCGEESFADTTGKIIKQRLFQFINECGGSELYKITNKKSRIAYFEQDKEMTISNTCNGDIILLGE